MFSVEQKRSIANAIQKILRDTGHPELPVGEIQFKLYVHGRYQWSWADIQNNGAVPVPSINPWNESQDKATPPDPQHGREPEKVKPLAQYLGEYLFHDDHTYTNGYGEKVIGLTPVGIIKILQQALDAYQSTENVTIKIERK